MLHLLIVFLHTLTKFKDQFVIKNSEREVYVYKFSFSD